MARLNAEVRFWVGGVWVTPDLVGATIEWPVGGRRISLSLPTEPSDFVLAHETETAAVPALSGTGRIADTPEAVAVNLVAVGVELDAELSLDERDEARKARDQGDPEGAADFASSAQVILEEGIDLACAAVDHWLQWVRATGDQPWLGIASAGAPQYGRARLMHPDSNDPLFQLGPVNRVTIRSGDTALDAVNLRRIHARLADGDAPPVVDLLLNDAVFLTREAISADAARALLAAAMACEIKSKEVILACCYPDARAAVEQLVHRTSNVPRLLDAVLSAATGLSLKSMERELYRQISDLFHRRNEIVHEGWQQEPSQAWPLVVAARQAVAWLDEIEPRSPAWEVDDG